MDPLRHGSGTEKSSLQLCLDVALKNTVGLGLDSHLTAPGGDSEEEMSFESRVLEKSKLSPLLGTNICVSVWQPLVPELSCTR